MAEKPRLYRQETTGIPYRVGDLYGYPDSLIRARTGAAYRDAIDLLSTMRDNQNLDKPRMFGTVVDYGSGRGHGIPVIQQLYPQRIISIDKYEPYLSVAQKEGLPPQAKNRLQFIWTEDAMPLATGSVDAVFLMHTIEHIKNPLELLKDIHRSLTPEGLLVVATPDEKNLVGPSPYDEKVFAEPELVQLLSEAGFNSELFYGVPSDAAWKVHRRKHWLAHNAPITGRIRNHVSPTIWEATVLRSGIKVMPLTGKDFSFSRQTNQHAIDIMAVATKKDQAAIK